MSIICRQHYNETINYYLLDIVIVKLATQLSCSMSSDGYIVVVFHCHITAVRVYKRNSFISAETLCPTPGHPCPDGIP